MRLQQTLINLLGNALKFTESGQVVLTVSGTPGPADECELRFSVADSGPGVPAEQLGTIFEPYAQAEASTSRRFGGTGLGLPITQRIVALMGGRLWLDSQIGQGSTFHFTLPAAIPPDIAASLLRAPVASSAGLGIGLYQAARQAEASGYRLELESNRDGEVCFVLTGAAKAA